MRVVSLDEIRPILENKADVLEAVKQGFVQHSGGHINMPDPVQLIFGGAGNPILGDCHIKTASSSALPYFCVKVASGFYQNPAKGLPVNNGMVMLFSSETGQPLALFQDDGHMTSVRTAAAGALSASLAPAKHSVCLGIIGTGHQAEMQARWISECCNVSQICLWGRSPEKASALKDRLDDLNLPIDTVSTVADLCAGSNVIVTTTPSTSPILFGKDVADGQHIIAVGSDSPGKIELDPAILAKADIIIIDDQQQCLNHGEFGHAVRAGLVAEDAHRSLGQLLGDSNADQIGPDSLSVVDLTGLGAQDLALASFVYENLDEQSAA